MAIYTRTGDQGETDLLGGLRVAKDTVLLEVCGTLDELSTLLGLARSEVLPEGVDALLEQIQRRLFDVGAELAAAGSKKTNPSAIGPQDVTTLEQVIDRYEARIESTGTFILPAGSRATAVLHVARAVCRRAERRLVTLARSQPQSVSSGLFSYLNRLSDLLFVLARVANAQAGMADKRC